ncbi:MAG: efflux transporter outer membrane subunit [Anaerolineae bacterium]|nr:efflux transporter outer membrane subunit [Phycisphaerae bacterium]
MKFVSMMNVTMATTAILGAAMIAGCSVGPDYKPPQPKLPESYGATTQPTSWIELRQWWTTFNDKTLDSLIDRAAVANLDLKLAAARIREARAARGVVNADFYPSVDGTGSFRRSRDSQTAFNNGNDAGDFGGSQVERNLFEVGFDSTWEIDVFGGVRRSVEAANADIQVSIEDQRDVLVTLLGDVARNYVELRGRQRRLAITRANLKSQQETLELTRARFNAGMVGELDFARSKALADTTAAQLPLIQQNVKESIHRLSVLIGREPSALLQELGTEGPIPVSVSELPVGMPSDLLRRRPDIRRAERQLAAQSARIGVATADLFPRFSLTGSLGLQSEEFKDLGNSESIFFNYGPGFRWNLFNAGKFRSNIAVQNAREEQQLVLYEQTVLNSLEEVENALTAFQLEQNRRTSLQSSVEANRRAVTLANDLYSRGLTDYLAVQETQRNLLSAEDQLALSEQAVSSNLVALYKALGGGWEE